MCTTLLWVGPVHAQNAGGLPACMARLKQSNSNLLTCDNSLSACNNSLTTCTNELSKAQAFPATGQTTSYAAGDDGAIRAGAVLSYTDNGDDTITDNNTKLMWEKKDQASGGLHNVNNTYPWSGLCQDGTTACGTDADCSGQTPTTCTATDGQGTGLTIFQWVAQLNSGAGFAGHTDWRVPNIRELESIVDFQNNEPAVDAAFNANCQPNCTVDGAGGTTECSCPAGGGDITDSATTFAGNTDQVWSMNFDRGNVGLESKPFQMSARAVRGGL